MGGDGIPVSGRAHKQHLYIVIRSSATALKGVPRTFYSGFFYPVEHVADHRSVADGQESLRARLVPIVARERLKPVSDASALSTGSCEIDVLVSEASEDDGEELSRVLGRVCVREVHR